MKQQPLPVIAVNGFLESGKTYFLNDAFDQELFIDPMAHCVLVRCEQGNNDYDPRLLRRNHVTVVDVDEPEQLTPAFWQDIATKYRPDLVYIEQNAMWDPAVYALPQNFYLAQQLTVVNAVEFQTYFNNMRQRVVDLLRDSEVVIMFNCDDEPAVTYLKRNLQLINPKLGFLLFDSKGNTVSLADDLPYKVDTDYINVADRDFGIFYVDSMENPDRYRDKTVELTVRAVLDDSIPKGFFVGGRRVMTCCANDVAFYFVLCQNTTSTSVKNGDWLRIVGQVSFHELGGEPHVVCVLTAVTKLPPRPDDETIDMSAS